MPELNVSNGFTQRDYPRSAPRRGVTFLTSVFSYLGYQILEPLILIGIDARRRVQEAIAGPAYSSRPSWCSKPSLLRAASGRRISAVIGFCEPEPRTC
jgi:hypothetical protein